MFDFLGLFGKKKRFEITRKTTMGEILKYDQGIAQVLMEHGMHCVGCPSSTGEALETACTVHGMDVDAVLASIEAYRQAKGN